MMNILAIHLQMVLEGTLIPVPNHLSICVQLFHVFVHLQSHFLLEVEVRRLRHIMFSICTSFELSFFFKKERLRFCNTLDGISSLVGEKQILVRQSDGVLFSSFCDTVASVVSVLY